MTTTIKVEFSEQSKCVTAQTKVESDELGETEVLKLAKNLATKAQEEAREMSMLKQR